MTQLITENLRRLPLVSILSNLASDYKLTSVDESLDDYVYDVVKTFINSINLEVSDFEKSYLQRLFYCNKGTSNVFLLLKSHLGIDIEYSYDGVNLDLVIHSISTSDPNLLDRRFTEFLYHLVYYYELSIIYETLIFLVRQKLSKIYTKIDIIRYKEFNVTL